MHVLDPRLVLIQNLEPDIFRDRHVLDMGCNNGFVTVQLASSFGAAAVTGVEVDPNLIRRAQDHLSFTRCRSMLGSWSRSRPGLRGPPASSVVARDTIHYFPVSSVLDHGHRPPPDGPRRKADPRDGGRQSSSSSSSSGGGGGGDNHRSDGAPEPRAYLDNVDFVTEDWARVDVSSPNGTSDTTPHPARYDTILALSVVKWIHLTHLDAGLERFLSRCGAALREQGHLVIELQPWSSYQNAVKPHKAPHLARNLARLTIKPDQLGRLLQDRGFIELARSDALPRSVYIYRKIAKAGQ